MTTSLTAVAVEPVVHRPPQPASRVAGRTVALVALGAFTATALLGGPLRGPLGPARAPDQPVFADANRTVVAATLAPGWWPSFERSPFFEPLPATHLLALPRVRSDRGVLLEPSIPMLAPEVAVTERYHLPGTREPVVPRELRVGDQVDVTYVVTNRSGETLRGVSLDDPVLGVATVAEPIEPFSQASVTVPDVVVPVRVDQDELPRLPLGTDPLGRDLASRLTAGAWRLLQVAGGAAVLSFVLGGLVGWLASRSGRPLLLALGRARLVLATFPFLMVSLVIVSLVGTSVSVLVLLAATLSVPIVARQVRDAVLRRRRGLHSEVARSLGWPRAAIERRIVAPAAARTAGANALLVAVAAATVETSLGFIGLTPERGVSLGAMVADVRWVIESSPGYLLLPGLLIVAATGGCTVLAADLGMHDTEGTPWAGGAAS